MDSNIFFKKKERIWQRHLNSSRKNQYYKKGKKKHFRLLSYTFLAFANMFMLNLQSQNWLVIENKIKGSHSLA